MRMILGSLALAVSLAALGCDRGANGSQPQMPRSDLTRAAATRSDTSDTVSAGVQPGISPQAVLGHVVNPYAGQASAASTGRQLFLAFNCAGCHSGYAGGGMGPSLRDSLWIYGSNDAQIFSTIAEGRPYGMPAWGTRLTDDQIWMLVSYIRTLGKSGEPEKPPTPSQKDVRVSPDSTKAS
jgi:cytochrome c oxidase cbb3-type subunit III